MQTLPCCHEPSLARDLALLQAIVNHGGIDPAARRTDTELPLLLSAVERLQSRCHTNTIIETIVLAYRAGWIQ